MPGGERGDGEHEVLWELCGDYASFDVSESKLAALYDADCVHVE